MAKRSKFSLSHSRLFSCDMGELVPIAAIEALPGDTIQHATSALVRASPMLTPVMHPVHVRIHHWFVPYRLLWDKWEDFITGGPDGLDASVFPTINVGSLAAGSLGDYLGLPLGVAGLTVSALPFRAYAKVWNEWYRDQDLQTPLVISTASGADTTTNTTLQNCGWEKDYFTSARPWEQKGASITIPLGTLAPVKGLGANTNANNTNVTVTESSGASTLYGKAWNSANASFPFYMQESGTPGRPNVYADLSNASAITVTALRQALSLQRFEEARARFGSRYVEYLRYLGVRSSDARLQRSEYLGGGRQTIQFSEIVQTAADGTNPVGTLRGHGLGAMRSNRYRRYFEEHGIVLSFMSTRPKTMYMQGTKRMWNRTVKTDFWQQELQHIGQQAIQNKELYALHSSPTGTYGYQDRYDEYRREESGVAGEFRTTLNMWHLARDFSSDPALNATFVKCVPTERIFAVPSTDNLWIMAKHNIQARRLVAKTGSSFIF